MSKKELREQLSVRHGAYCQGCGFVPPIPDALDYFHADHRLPKALGGSDDISNRALLCGPCNLAKGRRLSLSQLRLNRIEKGRMVRKAWNRAWYDKIGHFGEPA